MQNYLDKRELKDNKPYMKSNNLRTGIAVLLLMIFLISVCLFLRTDSIYCGSSGQYRLTDIFGLKLLSYSMPGTFNILSLNADENAAINSFKAFGKYYALCMYHNNTLKIYYNANCEAEYKIETGMEILSSTISDFNNDNDDEIFLLLKDECEEYGDRLLILSYNGKEMNAFYDQSFKKVNPWKVQVCDVDGDGEKEISLGVYTIAKYHPVYAKRPFIYYYNENKLYPKWLGSRLSRPFDDYIFCDIDKDKMDELISIETTKDGKKELNSYKWKGFGFESIGTSASYHDIYDLAVKGTAVSAVCVDNDTNARKIFKYKNGRLE